MGASWKRCTRHAPVMTCGVCGQLGWDESSDGDHARRQRAAELRRLTSGPAPVVLVRRCADRGLFHVQEPKFVQLVLRLPPRPWSPVPSHDGPDMTAYFDAVRAAVLEAVQQQGLGHRWPRNPEVASRYGIPKSLATELRSWLVAEDRLRLDGDYYVTQARPTSSEDES
ncbi:hypothetical protein ACIA8G_35035 [Lentzea sp. NPDC051213]|uniref:hypothetical protein n=1 Tax=Lentzea sp. NPDC051213 TaxID=3364126 RepID=UPI0037B9EAE8